MTVYQFETVTGFIVLMVMIIFLSGPTKKLTGVSNQKYDGFAKLLTLAVCLVGVMFALVFITISDKIIQ